MASSNQNVAAALAKRKNAHTGAWRGTGVRLTTIIFSLASLVLFVLISWFSLRNGGVSKSSAHNHSHGPHQPHAAHNHGANQPHGAHNHGGHHHCNH